MFRGAPTSALIALCQVFGSRAFSRMPIYLAANPRWLKSSKAEYLPVLESKLERMKQDVLDKSVPIVQRREKAERYHKKTNEKILFFDETGGRRFLEPTAASKRYDKV